MRITSKNLRAYLLSVFALVAILVACVAMDGVEASREIVSVSSADGEIDETFIAGPGFDGSVLDMAMQGDGKIVAVGFFKAPMGYPSRYIVRLDADGNIDQTFLAGTGANDVIRKIRLMPDGRMIICGGFTTYNDTPVRYIARINADGTLDPTFNSGVGPSGGIITFDIDGSGGVIFAGSFANVGGVPTGQVARFDAAGNLDTTFQTTWNFNNSIRAIKVLASGKLLVGGFFLAGGPLNVGLVRLNANGSTDTAFHANGPVLQIKETGAGVYVSGNFSAIFGISRKGLIRMIGDTLDPSFASESQLIEIPDFVVRPDGKLYVCGHIIRPDGSNAAILRLNANGTDDQLTLTNAAISTMFLEPNGTLVAGGLRNEGIRRLNGPYNSGIIKLDQAGEVVPNYLTRTAAGASGSTKLVALADGKMLGWGDFWPNRRGLVRLTSEGLVDESYDPPLTEFFAAAALQSDGTAYVGGHREGNDQTFRIRRVLADGTLDPGFTAGGRWTRNDGTGNLKDLAVQPDGRVIAVGNFAEINGVPRLNIVRLMANGDLDPTFSFATPTWDIYKVEIDKRSGRIFIGGRTNSYSGATTIYELAPNGAIIWQTRLESSYDDLRGMSQTADGDLLITGSFTRVQTQVVSRIAKLNADGTLDQGFAGPVMVPEYRGFQTAFELPDGRIVVGGTFWNIPTARDIGHVSRLFADGRLDPSFNMTLTCSNSCLDPVKSIVRQPDGKLVISGGFESVNGRSKWRNVRLKPFAGLFSISGRVVGPDGRAIRSVPVSLVDEFGIRRMSTTSPFGIYQFSDIPGGRPLTITAASKRYRFAPRVVTLEGNLVNVDLVGLE